jgi:hypothetical protein
MGNPRTDAAPTWLPQIATPLRGEEPHRGNDPIQYHRFSEMADDVVDVRVYQGIHFRRADVVGRRQGKRAALPDLQA